MKKHILSRKTILMMMSRYMKENPRFWYVIAEHDHNQEKLKECSQYMLLYYFLDVGLHHKINYEAYKNLMDGVLEFNKKILRRVYYEDIVTYTLMQKGSEYYNLFTFLSKKINVKPSERNIKNKYINSALESPLFTMLLEAYMGFGELVKYARELQHLKDIEYDYLSTLLN